jgi:SAM-dependent methyltransferase
VLELGVGTGRVALALAEAGFEVVGVDRARAMLEGAASRIAKKPRRVRDRIALREADMRDLRLRRRFPLVIAPFNALQHVHDARDLARTLRSCRAHLATGGRIAFDVLLPDPAGLARDPARFYRCPPVVHPRDGRRYDYAEAFAYDHSTQVQTVTMRFTDRERPERVFFSRLAQRQYFPQELVAAVRHAGLALVSHHGGFRGETLDEYADSQVLVARKERGPSR